jgi:hypothetical protein
VAQIDDAPKKPEGPSDLVIESFGIEGSKLNLKLCNKGTGVMQKAFRVSVLYFSEVLWSQASFLDAQEFVYPVIAPGKCVDRAPGMPRVIMAPGTTVNAIAIADPAKLIEESDEQNNVKEASFEFKQEKVDN